MSRSMTSVQVPDELVDIVCDVLEELASAQEQYPPFQGPHEAWAKLYEEVDELWDEVKRKKIIWPDMLKEAKQSAAMAIRFMLDVKPL